ncbi:DUF2306 domain-containing protein [Occultella gossypii]|uniref:DUF2306 domain-containing protein n=1 Tax=Occultella gossypii TaxID=2800820 RepID=A0ABS7SBU6_9MICO|nr:DUF2306 domain-containing protein [Occultella gossypii]MBZ2197834.1 DUF2306 domain-containing protein [Occultella gossypii]
MTDQLTRPVNPDRRDAIVAAMSKPPAAGKNRYRVVVVTFLSLGVVAYAAVIYGGFDVSTSMVDTRDELSWHYPVLWTHIATGAIALTLGPLQFVRRIRRVPRVHRYIGRVYLFAGVVPSSIVGIVVALLTTSGPVAAAGLVVGDVLWISTAALAYRHARAGRYRQHGQWMIRNFAVTFAAVTFRAWLGLTIVGQLPILESVYGGDFDALFDVAYAMTCWLAFIPNLLFVNLFLRRRRAAAHPRR